MSGADVIPDEPPPGLFFAGSDDDDDIEEADAMSITDVDQVDDAVLNPRSSPSGHQSPQTSSSRSSPMIQRLFLDDEDEDDNGIPIEVDVEVPNAKKRQATEPDSDSDIEIIEKPTTFHERVKNEKSTAKASNASSSKRTSESPPVAKKRRLSPPQPEVTHQSAVEDFSPTYIGEVLIPNAWSNVSGKGYVKPNDHVIVKRDADDPGPAPSKSKVANRSNEKMKSDGKKQITLATMLKSQPPKAAKKKKGDTIVRLVNKKGFGMCQSFLVIQLLNLSLRIWSLAD
jgi:DNA repair protein RAD5